MEGLSASVVLIAIMLGVLLVVAFDVFCLLRLATADTAHFLPKFAWAVLIVCTSPIGDSDRRAISGPLTPGDEQSLTVAHGQLAPQVRRAVRDQADTGPGPSTPAARVPCSRW